LEQLKALHKTNGYKFELPNIDHPLVLVKKCLVDEMDSPRMVALGRLHINAMLFVDPFWGTPEGRLQAIAQLQDEMCKEAAEKGLDIATTQAEGRFAQRLSEPPLKWTKGFGEMFFRNIDE
jgi:hypothetical protein